jgi:hypothetical protein
LFLKIEKCILSESNKEEESAGLFCDATAQESNVVWHHITLVPPLHQDQAWQFYATNFLLALSELSSFSAFTIMDAYAWLFVGSSLEVV